MSADHIARIQIDDQGLPPASPEAEQERNIAIFDLLEGNSFVLADASHRGPYALNLRLQNRQLVFEITPESGETVEIALQASAFRKRAREYFEVCDSYLEAVRSKSPDEIAQLDEGRKALHDEGAEFLAEKLHSHATVDSNTARRLFTLLCSLVV